MRCFIRRSIRARPTCRARAARRPTTFTYIDALNLYHLDQARQRALMSANWLPLRSTVAGSPLRMETTRATTRGFFPMFAVPFQYGAPWSEQDDTRRAQVVVISQKLNDILFGGADSVGRELIIATKAVSHRRRDQALEPAAAFLGSGRWRLRSRRADLPAVFHLA
ncbi:ABC transporter permease, partial [mine drainage metagenome]